MSPGPSTTRRGLYRPNSKHFSLVFQASLSNPVPPNLPPQTLCASHAGLSPILVCATHIHQHFGSNHWAGSGMQVEYDTAPALRGSPSSWKNGQIDKLLSCDVRGSLCRGIYKARQTLGGGEWPVGDSEIAEERETAHWDQILALPVTHCVTSGKLKKTLSSSESLSVGWRWSHHLSTLSRIKELI